ncbi:MAG: glycosyltransferase family 2 protein [Crocinitomicaceae bacterium]|nr:glycosyltransferase family 2 protein [Crocinitomicaceae bacterium]
MKLSVVLPAYNEAENIGAVITELQNVLNTLQEVKSYEIIVVDDQSADGTMDEVKKMKLPNVRCLRLSRRSGSHTAIRAGLLEASGDGVLCLSADGQDDPVVLREMIEKFKNGAHTVWAIRDARRESFADKLAASMFYFVLQLFASEQTKGIDLANADFYLLSRKTVNAINSCAERNTSLFGLIVWVGFRQDFVTYNRRGRISGHSKWTMRSRLKLAKDWITAFSGIPLRMITYVGISSAVLGIIYAAYIFTMAIAGKTTPGWAETAIFILCGTGLILIMLGVIGEYLWGTLDESRKRPLFFIEENSADQETREEQKK